MGTPQLGASPFQEPTRSQQDSISSWLDRDDEEFFQQDIISSWLDLDDDEFSHQELQDLENHLFNLDQTDPISSSSLPIPEGSPFMLDHLLQPNIQNHPHQPILSVEQCVEPANVCDTFLNDHEFGLISPTDLSPDITNNVNDQFCETMISVKPVGDVEIISEPVITTFNVTESNKTDNEDGIYEDRPKQGALGSKNAKSERNRRKRISKQLISLRALVPNITKMDKRSVLVDALSYLRKIQEDTEMLQKKIKEVHPKGRPKLNDLRESNEDNASKTFGIRSTTLTSASVAVTKSKAQITKIDTEKIEDKIFIVKITCRGGVNVGVGGVGVGVGVGDGDGDGVGSDVLRVFEYLDYEITYAALQQKFHPQEVVATIYVRVRKQGKKMTEEKLKHSITNMALRIGLNLPNPNSGLDQSPILNIIV